MIPLHASGVQHTIGKLSTRATTLLQTSSQSKAHKVARVPTLGISKFPLGNPKTKCHLDASPMAKHIVYYKGKVVASPKSGPWWVLWIRVCPWVVLARKVLQLCTNQLVVWFVQVRVSDWLLVILPSLILEPHHAPLPPKCSELRNVTQLLILPLFSL
jgi:hypothetical protein